MLAILIPISPGGNLTIQASFLLSVLVVNCKTSAVDRWTGTGRQFIFRSNLHQFCFWIRTRTWPGTSRAQSASGSGIECDRAVIIVPVCQEISRQIRFDKFEINLPSIYPYSTARRNYSARNLRLWPSKRISMAARFWIRTAARRTWHASYDIELHRWNDTRFVHRTCAIVERLCRVCDRKS